MALQSSGQISLSQVATAFSTGYPIKMSTVYNTDTLPTGGVIKMSNCYGQSAGPAYFIFDALNGSSTGTIRGTLNSIYWWYSWWYSMR